MVSLKQILDEVDKSKDELVELLRELVRIPTVNTGIMPTGNELGLCQFLQQRLAKEDIKSEILISAPNRANLVARLNWQGEKPKIMLMSHSDVVPAEDEAAWRFPPFSGALADGRVYGRGASDCKGLLVCEAMALILLKRLGKLGLKLKNDISVVVGADEEVGGKYGFGWLAEHHPDKLKADFAINEGGGTAFNTDKGTFFGIALGEKGRMEAKIKISGKSSHAALPWLGDNSLLKLAAVIKRLESYKPELNTDCAIFNRVAEFFAIDEQTPVTPQNVDRIIEQISKQNRLLATILKGLSRMTITPTMLSGGVKSNIVPEKSELICDIRTLPHQDINYARAELERLLSDLDGLEIEVQGTADSNESEYRPQFFEAIQSTVQEALGAEVKVKVKLLPYLTVGFTDSRLVRSVGTTVYNFSPSLPSSDTSQNNVHGKDESIAAEDLVFRTKFLLALAYKMLV